MQQRGKGEVGEKAAIMILSGHRLPSQLGVKAAQCPRRKCHFHSQALGTKDFNLSQRSLLPKK